MAGKQIISSCDMNVLHIQNIFAEVNRANSLECDAGLDGGSRTVAGSPVEVGNQPGILSVSMPSFSTTE